MKLSSGQARPRSRLLGQFWLLTLVVCVGAGLIAAALLGANLRAVRIGSTVLTFGVLLYVAYVSYTVGRKSKDPGTQLDQALRNGRLAKSRSTFAPFRLPDGTSANADYRGVVHVQS